jgi:DNA anti-recombination protein RmuC
MRMDVELMAELRELRSENAHLRGDLADENKRLREELDRANQRIQTMESKLKILRDRIELEA